MDPNFRLCHIYMHRTWRFFKIISTILNMVFIVYWVGYKLCKTTTCFEDMTEKKKVCFMFWTFDCYLYKRKISIPESWQTWWYQFSYCPFPIAKKSPALYSFQCPVISGIWSPLACLCFIHKTCSKRLVKKFEWPRFTRELVDR